ncbi:unnamed protein product [Prunus armeniaca]
MSGSPASVLNAEDLVRIGRTDIVFNGVVGGSSHGRTTTYGGDHVDLPLVRVRRGWEVVHIFIQLPFTNKSFNDVAQGNTRFGIMATELMKMAEDTYVWHRLVGRSPGGRLGYDRCLMHQDILIGSVQGGEDLKPRLGCEGEWGMITCPRRVASAGLVVVAMFALLATAEDTEAGGGSPKVLRVEVVEPHLELKYSALASTTVPEVELAEVTLESTKGSAIVSLWATRVVVAEAGCILTIGFIITLLNHVQVVCGVQAICLNHEMVQEGLL